MSVCGTKNGKPNRPHYEKKLDESPRREKLRSKIAMNFAMKFGAHDLDELQKTLFKSMDLQQNSAMKFSEFIDEFRDEFVMKFFSVVFGGSFAVLWCARD